MEVQRVPVRAAHQTALSGSVCALGDSSARATAHDEREPAAEPQHDEDADHAGDAAAEPVVVDEAAP